MITRKGNVRLLSAPVYLSAYAALGGPDEAKGPLGESLDLNLSDPRMGQKSWEKAEGVMAETLLRTLFSKGSITPDQIDLALAGDLQAQCTATSVALRVFDIPFLGLYGACSTFAEALLLGSALIDGGSAQNALAFSTSHYATAQRQYRMPLPYGSQRPPSAQRTVTGGGAVYLSQTPSDLCITAFMPGRIRDMGISDPAAMGNAMAAAAAESILTFLSDTSTTPADYDKIITGDLGSIGCGLVSALATQEGVNLSPVLEDCGKLVYYPSQDSHAGASGAGCSGMVLCSRYLPALACGKLNRILFCGTGALLSAITPLQTESIPGICHIVLIERRNLHAL